MKGTKTNRKGTSGNCGANVLIELRVVGAMSEEVLDANSDDVLEAVQKHAADVALGPAIALNLRNRAIKLRFDVIARNEAAIYRQIAKVMEVIEKRTDLRLYSSRSFVDEVCEDEQLVAA